MAFPQCQPLHLEIRDTAKIRTLLTLSTWSYHQIPWLIKFDYDNDQDKQTNNQLWEMNSEFFEKRSKRYWAPSQIRALWLRWKAGRGSCSQKRAQGLAPGPIKKTVAKNGILYGSVWICFCEIYLLGQCHWNPSRILLYVISKILNTQRTWSLSHLNRAFGSSCSHPAPLLGGKGLAVDD